MNTHKDAMAWVMLINNVMCLCARNPAFFGLGRTFERRLVRAAEAIEEAR
ncbi:hypothetical protein [Mesorhizobium temperatum]|nr:hypothetical protein [Mesorhizobium temperatum]